VPTRALRKKKKDVGKLSRALRDEALPALQTNARATDHAKSALRRAALRLLLRHDETGAVQRHSPRREASIRNQSQTLGQVYTKTQIRVDLPPLGNQLDDRCIRF
jgi:hypothetical protein